MARKLNCDAIIGMINAKYIADYHVRVGYTVVKEQNYDEYRDSVTGERVFAGLPEEYKCCSLVAKMVE